MNVKKQSVSVCSTTTISMYQASLITVSMVAYAAVEGFVKGFP